MKPSGDRNRIVCKLDSTSSDSKSPSDIVTNLTLYSNSLGKQNSAWWPFGAKYFHGQMQELDIVV